VGEDQLGQLVREAGREEGMAHAEDGVEAGGRGLGGQGLAVGQGAEGVGGHGVLGPVVGQVDVLAGRFLVEREDRAAEDAPRLEVGGLALAGGSRGRTTGSPEWPNRSVQSCSPLESMNLTSPLIIDSH
jgi:hypothetical protein